MSILSNLLSGVLLGGMLALIALGLSVVLGVMRLINLAHGEILVAGAYVAFFLGAATGIDPPLLMSTGRVPHACSTASCAARRYAESVFTVAGLPPE